VSQEEKMEPVKKEFKIDMVVNTVFTLIFIAGLVLSLTLLNSLFGVLLCSFGIGSMIRAIIDRIELNKWIELANYQNDILVSMVNVANSEITKSLAAQGQTERTPNDYV